MTARRQRVHREQWFSVAYKFLDGRWVRERQGVLHQSAQEAETWVVGRDPNKVRAVRVCLTWWEPEPRPVAARKRRG